MDGEVTASNPVERSHLAPAMEWMGVALYLVLTFGISWSIFIGLRALDVPFGIRTSIGMFGPAVAAVLVRVIRREGFGDAGLRLTAPGRPGAWRMYLVAYLLMPLLIALAIGFALLTGVQHWAFSENLHALGSLIAGTLAKQHQSLPAGYSPDQLALINVVAQTALAFTLGIVFNMIFTFGEEFGWRGYLLPRLAPLGGVSAAIITGVIWGLWHTPVIVLDGYNYPGYPWAGVGVMVIFTVALGMIFAWLRFRSGSVWPSVLGHAAYNAQAGFGVLLLSPGNPLLRAPIGLVGLVPMIAFAIWLAATGRLKADV